MRLIHLLVLVFLVSLVTADTLDFARHAVVVTSIDAGPVELHGAAGLNQRATSLLKATTYDRDLTVGEWLAAHSQASRRLERMSLDSRRVGTKFLSDGAVTAEFEFPLTGAILTLVLPPMGGGRLLGKTACPCCGQAWPEGKEPPRDVKLVPYENGNLSQYTGILVDVRGLGFVPALFPRVVTEDGDVVIGPEFASAEYLVQSGAFGYYRDRSEAFLAERIGAGPLVVRALRVTGKNLCDVVVSQYDASRIHGSRANIELLSRCRVGMLAD